MISQKTLVASFVAVLLAVVEAQAEPYRNWSDHVEKANRGVKICASAVLDAIGGKTETEWKKYLPEATRTCAVMKANFNTTMLTVRLNVNGIDSALESYHSFGLATFDALGPQPGESPLEYHVRSLKLNLELVRAHYALEGGR